MARYYTAFEPDLGFYPNYSFEVGDIDGDGRKELAAVSTDGNWLRVLRLDGSVVLERRLRNYGQWGSVPLLFLDLNGDGRQELLVPDGPAGSASVIALNAENEVVRQVRLDGASADDYGVAVPLLSKFRRDPEGRIGISVALAGGQVVALDRQFRVLWTQDGFRHDFGHDFFNGDANGDGQDEIVFCTVDHINRRGPEVQGELVILRADGSLYFRRPVRQFYDDTHFDDVAVVDMRGTGEREILVEKGILFNLRGQVIWDISDQFQHGQWIATLPNPTGPGMLAFISELWSTEGRSKLIGPNGQTLWELTKDRITRLHRARLPGGAVLPTRAHAVDWFKDGQYEIVLGEQVAVPTGRACYEDVTIGLKLSFFDLQGRVLATLPFQNTCLNGFWYNGEVRSRVTDMDNDGAREWVFPRQDGKVMIIKKER